MHGAHGAGVFLTSPGSGDWRFASPQEFLMLEDVRFSQFSQHRYLRISQIHKACDCCSVPDMISLIYPMLAQLMLSFPTSLTTWRCCKREQSGNGEWQNSRQPFNKRLDLVASFLFLFSTLDTLQTTSDMLKYFEHVVRPQFSS